MKTETVTPTPTVPAAVIAAPVVTAPAAQAVQAPAAAATAPVVVPVTAPAAEAPQVEVPAPEKKTRKKAKAKTAKSTEPKKPKAKKVAKAEKAEAKEPPHTGQSAPERDIPYAELSDNERKVLDCFDPEKPERETKTIKEMSAKAFTAFKSNPVKQNYFTRNALRDLVCAKWLEKVARGTYRLTVKGKNRLQKLDKA